jgi:hypothetical protein
LRFFCFVASSVHGKKIGESGYYYPVLVGMDDSALARSSIAALTAHALMLRRFEAQHRDDTLEERAAFFSPEKRSSYVVNPDINMAADYALCQQHGFSFARELLPSAGDTKPVAPEAFFARYLGDGTFDCTSEEDAHRPVVFLEGLARELGFPLQMVGTNSLRRYSLYRIICSGSVESQRISGRFMGHQDGNTKNVNGTYSPGLELDDISSHLRNVFHRVLINLISRFC